MILINRIIVAVFLLPGFSWAIPLENSLLFGQEFEFKLAKTGNGYLCSGSIEARSIYKSDLKIVFSGLELVDFSADELGQVASFSAKPLKLSAGNISNPSCENLGFKGKITEDIDPSVFLAPFSLTNGYQLLGEMKILRQTGAGWVGISGISFEVPLSAGRLLQEDGFSERTKVSIDLSLGDVDQGFPISSFLCLDIRCGNRLDFIMASNEKPYLQMQIFVENKGFPLVLHKGELLVAYISGGKGMYLGSIALEEISSPRPCSRDGISRKICFKPSDSLSLRNSVGKLLGFLSDESKGKIVILGWCESSIWLSVANREMRIRHPFFMIIPLHEIDLLGLSNNAVLRIKRTRM
jgi:hypothetical protein